MIAINDHLSAQFLSPDVYDVNAILLSDGVKAGGFETESEIPDTNELHIYLPYLESYQQLVENQEVLQNTYLLTRILSACDLGPVRITPVTFEGVLRATVNETGGITCVPCYLSQPQYSS